MAFGRHYSTYYYELDETAKKRYREELQKLVCVCVCTAGIVVTTPCDSTTALAHGTYSTYLVLQLCFLPLISAVRGHCVLL